MYTQQEVGSSSTDDVTISIAKMGRDAIVHYWPQISEALDDTRALWEQLFTKDEILERCIAEHMQVWTISHGEVITVVFLTQIFTNRTGRYFQVYWMYGEGMVEALPLLDLALDDFAAKFNCTHIEVVGRKGFDRLLKPIGFEFNSATYHRPVRSNGKGN